MRTVAKRLLCLLYVLLLLAALGAPSAMADDDKEYSYPAAEFEVWLNEDGSATVEENWTVRFIRGSFTYYKEQIMLAPNKEEAFSGISGLEVEIDGTPCSSTSKSSGGPDYSYHLDQSKKFVTITCFRRSRGDTRTFTLRYRLENVVKYVEEDGYYIFSHRFIGARTAKTVNNVTVTVHTPEGMTAKPLYCTTSRYEEGEGETVFSGWMVKGTFKVKLRLDGEYFQRAVRLSREKLINRNDEKKHAKDDADKSGWIVLIVFAALIASPFVVVGVINLFKWIAWLFSRAKPSKEGERYRADCASEQRLREKIESYVPGQMSALELTALLPASSEEMVPLAVLAEMEHEGQLRRDRETETIHYYPDMAHTEAQKLMLQVLETCRRMTATAAMCSATRCWKSACWITLRCSTDR